jgi:hypothetical protein
MASVKRAAAAIATILVRKGVDYAQSKAVFKIARERAGLRAAPEHRGGVDRLPSQPMATWITPWSSRSVNVAGTRTRRQIIGLIPASQTLTCRIASPSAIAGEGFSSTRGSFDCRFIQPDLSHQPETPQIVMLSWYA